MQSQSLHVSVRGRVQGVGFRYFVLQHARQLALQGYTRNRADGSVEVVAVGPAAALDGLLERLRKGPPAARVEAVESEAQTVDATFEGFEIRN